MTVLAAEPSLGDLAVRLLGSLAVVVGLLLLIARGVNKRFKAPSGATIQVVHRQALGRGQGVAVVSVGSRVLVLGTTEQQITLLAEVEPEEVGIDVLADDTEEPDELDEPDELETAFGTTFETELAKEPVRQPWIIKPPKPAQSTAKPAKALVPGVPAAGPLVGSILSPQTWKQAVGAVTGQNSLLPTRRRAS